LTTTASRGKVREAPTVVKGLLLALDGVLDGVVVLDGDLGAKP
jgi:hypothetical protein